MIAPTVAPPWDSCYCRPSRESRVQREVAAGFTPHHLLLRLPSQLPHKTVNFIFQVVILNNESTILWGS